MIEAEPRDLSDSDADYAASRQQGSASRIGSEAGGEVKEEVVYVKENVSVHPTEYIADRISGRLSLIKQGRDLCLSWIPYRVGNLSSQLSEKDRYLYMIRLLEFTEIRSIHKQTPPLGWQYIVVLLSSGLAYPPLYFYNGGVNEFLDTIEQHVILVRSGDDANVLIVNVQLEKSVLVGTEPCQSPLAQKEWVAFLDSEVRVKDPKALTKRIFYGGVAHDLRKEVWPFLLGYHSYDSTYAEREYCRAVKREYETIKAQWQSISPYQAKRFTKFRERKRSIAIDVGMSDLLSPILYVMRDESEAFWCFSALVERLGANFDHSHSWVHSELSALSKLMEVLDSELHTYFKQNDCSNYLFCFPWILRQFKREFSYEEAMRLWEVLWTNHLSEHFHLYICIAILKQYRSKILSEQMNSNTLLLFITKLSGHIDLNETLRDAEALCISAGEEGKACIPPATPPSN